MKTQKVKRTEPIKIHSKDPIVGRISGAKLLHCAICGEDDRTHFIRFSANRACTLY
jgi:hypothetical protein